MAVRHAGRKPGRTRSAERVQRTRVRSRGVTAPPNPLNLQLRELVHTLYLAFCAASATAMALSNQGAERDQHLANLLDRCCATPLHDAVETLRKQLRELEGAHPPPSDARFPHSGLDV